MCKKKQCVRLDEEIKTYNNNISYYGSVNSFKLSEINTANLEIIPQRSHVISSINLDIDGFRQEYGDKYVLLISVLIWHSKTKWYSSPRTLQVVHVYVHYELFCDTIFR